jgi:predicted nucleic acid-binding protein
MEAARRLRYRLLAVGDDGRIVRADATLLDGAVTLAHEHGISVYDAAYVATARRTQAQLVSFDVWNLVSRDLARLPADTSVA